MDINEASRATGREETKRFRAKREAIRDAAAEVINEQSAKGMTFADVAKRVGLNTTSVTYYFKKKEDLAAAAFEATLDQLGAMVDEALRESTPETRVARYLAINMDRQAAIRRGEEKELAVLSDLRALEGDVKAELLKHWQHIFRKTRAIWGTDGGREQTDLWSGRTHVLLENIFWLPVWLHRYELDEYPRVEARLMDVFRRGIAGPGAGWAPDLLEPTQASSDQGREQFLVAATRLMNELGYRGASVEKIASELNVTKGSFYHHLDAKDELVVECYQRSLDLIAGTQRLGVAGPGSHWQKLVNIIATLLSVQFSERGPLLRTSALLGLPAQMRSAMVDRSNRIARRYAGILSDGIAEGSIRTIDPLVASQTIMALQNAAFDMRKWASTMPREQAVHFYASTILFGLFDEQMPDN